VTPSSSPSRTSPYNRPFVGMTGCAEVIGWIMLTRQQMRLQVRRRLPLPPQVIATTGPLRGRPCDCVGGCSTVTDITLWVCCGRSRRRRKRRFRVTRGPRSPGKGGRGTARQSGGESADVSCSNAILVKSNEHEGLKKCVQANLLSDLLLCLMCGAPVVVRRYDQ